MGVDIPMNDKHMCGNRGDYSSIGLTSTDVIAVSLPKISTGSTQYVRLLIRAFLPRSSSNFATHCRGRTATSTLSFTRPRTRSLTLASLKSRPCPSPTQVVNPLIGGSALSKNSTTASSPLGGKTSVSLHKDLSIRDSVCAVWFGRPAGRSVETG